MFEITIFRIFIVSKVVIVSFFQMTAFNPEGLAAFVAGERSEVLLGFEVVFGFGLEVEVGLFVEVDAVDAWGEKEYLFC